MNLNKFEKFKKVGKVQQMEFNKTIWGYTRVSSKEQSFNYSIQEQKKDIENYALKQNYTITAFHGGTYESAKGDLTRKEFKALIESVKKSKKKPFAIAIKFISRFSRAGGSAIGLVEQLINEVGVHLIETSSGITTETESGQMEIYDKLLESKKENMLRLERTLPGLKTFLDNGNWLGKPPRGYSINNHSRRKNLQEIIIYEEGNIIKKAWKWKAEGMSDVNIRHKLLNIHQYKISKQSLSAMWRKPFYVGINTNAMLDEVIKGSWPALISMKIWDEVQRRLESGKRKSGYEKAKVNEHRPLTGFIHCADCGAPITSYIAKKKQVHYYKCQHGKGGNMNAYSTPRSKKIGVNDSFINYLTKFELDNQDNEILRSQILLLTGQHNSEKEVSSMNTKKALEKLQMKLEKVNERYLMDDNSDESAYLRIKVKLNGEIQLLQENLKDKPEKLSNQEIILDKALKFCQNISNHWALGDIHKKVKIQKTLFPEGLIINPKNREYRTNKMNSLISAIEVIARDSETSENKKATHLSGLSSLVAGTGLEPVTFGL